jgi:hypothetical protein
VAGDPERLARFQREAEVLAQLNHPNIAAIYGLEDTPDVTALVLELVEGVTLADRIARGAMPVAEALPVARQMAEALEAAHEQGIPIRRSVRARAPAPPRHHLWCAQPRHRRPVGRTRRPAGPQQPDTDSSARPASRHRWDLAAILTLPCAAREAPMPGAGTAASFPGKARL